MENKTNQEANFMIEFMKLVCEDLTMRELESMDFNWNPVRNLAGFPKDETINKLELCLIAPSMILVKGDDDILVVLKFDGKEIYVESWELVEPIYFPAMPDDESLEYFVECCKEKIFPESLND